MTLVLQFPSPRLACRRCWRHGWLLYIRGEIRFSRTGFFQVRSSKIPLLCYIASYEPKNLVVGYFEFLNRWIFRPNAGKKPMAQPDPPDHPNASRERREQAKGIAAIGQQISAPLRDLYNQFTALVDHIKTNNQTAERNQAEYQKSYLWWTKFSARSAVVFSFLSLVLSFLVFLILKNQFAVMRLDQRAWINISVTWQPIAENAPLTAVVRIVNAGKTPAKRIEEVFVIEKLRAQQPPSLTYSDLLHLTGTVGIRIPNDPSETRVFMLNKEKPTVLDPPTLTKTDVDELNDGKAYIAVFGKVAYWDIHDIPHWIHYCTWHAPIPGVYAARQCSEYNDIDKN
jgi:hypothetical protein